MSLESIGAYRVIRPIGEGGMGTVLLAEQTGPVQRQVAVKILRADRDAREFVTRLEVERQAMAMLDHPGIAKVFEAGTTEDGRPYFVMEFFDGVPVTEWCDAARAPVEQRLEIFCGVCDAVQSAHQHGLIHRDLTPNNILVREVGGRPIVKVIDFGLVKALGRKLTDKTLHTADGQQVGTPEYMSPEQAEGTSVDTRTDVYSLGVVLYELLSGALPFEPCRLRDAGLLEMLRILREEEPPTPSSRFTTLGDVADDVAAKRATGARTLSRRIRGDLDWIVAKATAKDRRDRYAGVSELAADVRRHLGGEAVLAGPPTTIYRLRKLVRRHRVAFGVASAFAVFLVVALLVIAAYWRDAAESLQRFERLAGQDRLTELIRAAEEDLWPATPGLVPAFDRWLEEAREFAERIPDIDGEIVDVRRRSGLYDAHDDRWTFAEEHEATLHAALLDLRTKAALLAGDTGLIGDVERRRAWASELHRITIDESSDAWDRSIATARDRFDVELDRQVGLVPLDSDPESGCLEFALRTDGGIVPSRDEHGRLMLEGDDWEIVLVLIPGGPFVVGSEKTPGSDHFFAKSATVERPLLRGTLAPYMISKFEVTQAQWMRVMRSGNPSEYQPGQFFNVEVSGLDHPVEQVSWVDCMAFCRRLGATLPTEPQWEHAARAKTKTPWWPGTEPKDLFGVANLFGDEAERRFPGVAAILKYEQDWDDGYPVHAPVGTFRANPFGLHDVHGNVWEWCRGEIRLKEGYERVKLIGPACEITYPDEAGNGPESSYRAIRGGSFFGAAARARSSLRYADEKNTTKPVYGFRPVWMLR